MQVFLNLDKAPVAGEPITFTVKVINKQKVNKMMKVHLNAQAKEYNHRPSEELKTFWETHGVIQLAPMEGIVPLHLSTTSQCFTPEGFCGLILFGLYVLMNFVHLIVF